MGQEKILEFKKDFALLVEAGFLAIKQLDETSASRLFQAAQAILPTDTAPRMGMGYLAINKFEMDEATSIFEGILKQEPDNHLAQIFLGTCFLLTNKDVAHATKLIQSAVEKAADPTVKNFGNTALEWAKQGKFAKEAPVLAELKQKTKTKTKVK